ncbi:hypothetical protein [Picosynechococcus sp. NKBG042902]|uniref:hypothetical protein n=1 Tax=Picosynechococcus sp. NKBG042902 TaxID=490193 RepID=UPI0004ABC5DF|nr:hypothetical protein [Picosynechococcus sp. NKBG042902]
MSLLNLQFRTIAARLQVLDNSHPDLSFHKVSELVETHFGRELAQAIAKRQDPEDPHTFFKAEAFLWVLLGLQRT